MAKSLAQIQRQIEKLQVEAEMLRAQEIGGVVARIKEAIAHYDLTLEDLFGRRAIRKSRAAAGGARPGRRRGTRKSWESPIKYRDDKGTS